MALELLLSIFYSLPHDVGPIEIFPLSNKNWDESFHKSLQFRFTKRHLFALFFGVNIIKVKKNDGKILPKSTYFKEVIESGSRMAFGVVIKRIDTVKYIHTYSLVIKRAETQLIPPLQMLERKSWDIINMWNNNLVQQMKMQNAPTKENKRKTTPTKGIGSKTEIVFSKRKKLVGFLVMNEAKTKHQIRDYKYNIANREYILPVHYVPVPRKHFLHVTTQLQSKDVEIKKLREQIAHMESSIGCRIKDISRERKHMDIERTRINNERERISNERKRMNDERKRMNNERKRMNNERKRMNNEIENLKQQLELQKEKVSQLSNVGDCILNLKEVSRCPRSLLGQRFYNTAMALIPRVSLDGLSQAIPLIVLGFFADCGLTKFLNNNQMEAVANITPSPQTLDSNMLLAKNQAMFHFSQDIVEKVPFSLLADKGNKNGKERLIVQKAKWCQDSSRVSVVTISGDGSGDGSDNTTARKIDDILSSVDIYTPHDTPKAKSNGMCTDQGGGGVGESLVKVLSDSFSRVDNIHITAACSLHALNCPFQNAFQKSLGGGGLGVKSLLQGLHTAWSLQQALGEKFFLAWDTFVNDECPANESEEADPPKKLTHPLLTRWSYVTKCAKTLDCDWNKWLKFFNKCYECFDTTVGDLARNCVGATKNPKFLCELKFVTSFSDVFWTKHYAWMERVDEKTKTPGFSSHEMIGRIAIMELELKSLEGWERLDEFQECVTLLNSLPHDQRDASGAISTPGKETTRIQFNDFIRIFTENFEKNFAIWKRNCVCLSIASSNRMIAKGFALTYLHKYDCDTETSPEVILDTMNILDGSCDIHPCCSLTYSDWIKFLGTCTIPKNIILDRHLGAVREIAHGNYLYDMENRSDAMAKLLHDVESYFYIIPHCTQMTEQGVQESSLCSAGRKGEDITSSLVTLRSTDLMPIYRKIRDSYSSKLKKANQHMSSGYGEERIMRSKVSKKNQESRLRSEKELRTRFHPTKNRCKLHIQTAIETHLNLQDSLKIKSKMKQKRDDIESSITKGAAKRRRLDKATTDIQQQILSSKKKAESVPQSTIASPQRYQGSINISIFQRKEHIEFVRRELLQRGYTVDQLDNNLRLKTITEYRCELGRYFLRKRDVTQRKIDEASSSSYGSRKIWGNLKRMLDGEKDGLQMELRDPDNIRRKGDIFDISGKGSKSTLK